MREAVLHFSGFLYQGIYGMNYRVKDKITMADLAFRVQHVIKTEVDVTQAQLSRNNVEVLYGLASFIEPDRCQRREFARRPATYDARHRDRHRHQARGVAQGARSTAAPSSTAIRSWRCRRSARR